MSFIKHYFKEADESAEGKRLADKYGLHYNGWWDEVKYHTFTDMETGSTLLAKTEEELVDKLEMSRKAHKDAVVTEGEVHSSVLDGIKKNNVQTTDVGGELYAVLHHGTSNKNHNKILKSGKLKTSTYLTHDQKVARKFGSLQGGKTVTSIVIVKADGLMYDGAYFYTTRDLNFFNGMYN